MADVEGDHHGLPEQPLFYSVPEAARVLHMSKRTIYRYIENGSLKLKRVGKIRVLIHRDDLALMIAQDAPSPPRPAPQPVQRRRRR